ncbi:epoxyqueuosine reductase QueH [Enterococcus sp. BWB1-3]|uniref:epoxyqueuosine reductase QueH n=1 Tax=unclassified Enterococcus TaxID=2608891 RepID=UPI001923ACCE|nr:MULTISPECIES: epoxyqueuosine reductase QueH [unclassified Enterococcus]MBL1227719.1 epoxyqueuosine reductase QueH [Enterococcus sp. BWB1-3]MCB5952094.1 epoxyqueuosine reductase QueH [Enterococcus sp. BWT-B8]
MFDVTEITEKMNANQKINYDRVLQKLIKQWRAAESRPTILLHSCCAPCSTTALEYLTQYADITVYFANPNIHPRLEYLRREAVQQQFVEEFNKQTGNQVGFLSAPYEPNQFIQMVKKRQLAEEPEGGKRCSSCFQLRLDIAAEKAQELNYDYFGSALTLSPKKNSQLINEIGIEIQKFYQTNYLPSDFKKNNGYKRSIELCREYEIYRQCYCGCLFAAQKQGVDLKQISKGAQEFLKNQPED